MVKMIKINIAEVNVPLTVPSSFERR